MDSHELAGRLDTIAGDIAEDAYYLIAKDDSQRWDADAVSLYVYVGADFCGPCIDAVKTLIERQVGEDNDEKGVMIGGQSGSESDGPKACHWCGSLLSYSLTDEGAAQEMAHFDEYPPDPKITPGEAYALARILRTGSAQDDFVAKVGTWLAAHNEAVKGETA